MEQTVKTLSMLVGGVVGWFVGEFSPTFPLMLVAIAFIVYDSWSAFELDKRVKKTYPDKHKRPARFVSYKFWNTVPTITESLIVILLAYSVQKWVFVDFYVPLSYVAAGVIAAAQFVSIAENKCSCRGPEDRNYKLWRVLSKYFISKTERHFDIDLSELKDKENGEGKDRDNTGDSSLEHDSREEIS